MIEQRTGDYKSYEQCCHCQHLASLTTNVCPKCGCLELTTIIGRTLYERQPEWIAVSQEVLKTEAIKPAVEEIDPTPEEEFKPEHHTED